MNIFVPILCQTTIFYPWSHPLHHEPHKSVHTPICTDRHVQRYRIHRHTQLCRFAPTHRIVQRVVSYTHPHAFLLLFTIPYPLWLVKEQCRPLFYYEICIRILSYWNIAFCHTYIPCLLACTHTPDSVDNIFPICCLLWVAWTPTGSTNNIGSRRGNNHRFYKWQTPGTDYNYVEQQWQVAKPRAEPHFPCRTVGVEPHIRRLPQTLHRIQEYPQPNSSRASGAEPVNFAQYYPLFCTIKWVIFVSIPHHSPKVQRPVLQKSIVVF